MDGFELDLPEEELLQALPLAERVEKMYGLVNDGLKSVFRGSFNMSKAERFAALALATQFELNRFAHKVAFNAKQAKNEVKYIAGEVNSDYRLSKSEKKITEEALKQLVNKDERVKVAETKQADLEMQSANWEYMLNYLKDAHIFFRNLGK